MKGKTLFIVDTGATVGGIAQGITDLGALGLGDVDIRRVDFAKPESVDDCIAELKAGGPSSVAVGVGDKTAGLPTALASLLATPGRTLIYLNAGSRPEGQPVLSARRRVLGHVVVPADLSVRSGCLAACLGHVCRQGVGTVTLTHVAHVGSNAGCHDSALSQLGSLDTEWCEWLKSRLFKSGVSEVRIVVPNQSTLDADGGFGPDASLVLVGSTCDEHVVHAYLEAWRAGSGHLGVAPVLMFTAEGCSAAVGAGAA
ncbi:MAG: hypothetical protein HY876_10700 [Coriobacteriales bacterium]|nr:hypothetical protein [Coriobacteriales bacterium]